MGAEYSDEKISPVERARRLALKEKERQEREATERKEAKTVLYREIEERLKATEELIVGRQQELKEVQDGLDEIANIANGGLMTTELADLRAELDADKAGLIERIRADQRLVQELLKDPIYIEMTEAAEAAAAEVARVKAAEAETEAKNVERAKVRKTLKDIFTLSQEVKTAFEAARARELEISSLREDIVRQERERDSLDGHIRDFIGRAFYELPDKQRLAIERVVDEAEGGKNIVFSRRSVRDGRMVPSGHSVAEWYGTWHDKVTPGWFGDKALRGLRALENDPRIGQMQTVMAKLNELYDTQTALVEARNKTNTEFVQRFVAPDSIASSIDVKALSDLRNSNSAGRNEVDSCVKELADIRREINILLTGISPELDAQFRQSKFVSADSIETYRRR